MKRKLGPRQVSKSGCKIEWVSTPAQSWFHFSVQQRGQGRRRLSSSLKLPGCAAWGGAAAGRGQRKDPQKSQSPEKTQRASSAGFSGLASQEFMPCELVGAMPAEQVWKIQRFSILSSSPPSPPTDLTRGPMKGKWAGKLTGRSPPCRLNYFCLKSSTHFPQTALTSPRLPPTHKLFGSH